MKNTSHTPGPINYDGWFPPREPGLLPSLKANWDGRMIQLFTQDLEQGEIDMRLLQAAPDLLEACKFVLSQLDPNNDHPKTQCVLYSDCLSPKKTDDQSVVEYLKEAISKAEGNA